MNNLATSEECYVKLRSPTLAVLLLAVICSAGCSSGSSGDRSANTQPGIVSGPISQVVDSVGIFVWGEPLNQLCQQWSIALFERSGWFYGTSNPTSSADVYVLAAPADPLTVVAAENFPYSSGSVQAFEGDTVFFRGRNGFFGAWTIESIEGALGATLSGTWYFKAGGGGDFTSAFVSGGLSTYDTSEGVCDGF